MSDMLTSQIATLQETQAARFAQLAIYVGKPYCFFVCRKCGTALPLSRVPQHYSDSKNHNYERKDCVDLLQAWTSLYMPTHPIKLATETDLENWAHPLEPAAPIPHVRIKLGLHCSFPKTCQNHQRCPAIFRNAKRMKQHCVDEHGWKDESSKSRRGRPQKHAPPPWEDNVPCQQLVWTGRGTSFWRVYPNGGEEVDSEQAISDGALARRTQSPTERRKDLCSVWDEMEAK
ncbi:hypothetical protein GQ44DRAFT_728818 [Phaeosphaeriaceae sp. PMI808]|nr:hypothetical protein GQ44DRAFT_728818 [Phaeosphaeriaceae sp. PMI808]